MQNILDDFFKIFIIFYIFNRYLVAGKPILSKWKKKMTMTHMNDIHRTEKCVHIFISTHQVHLRTWLLSHFNYKILHKNLYSSLIHPFLSWWYKKDVNNVLNFKNILDERRYHVSWLTPIISFGTLINRSRFFWDRDNFTRETSHYPISKDTIFITAYR